jgi:transcriptional regulator of acetoin/glycerol metabolism
MPLNTVEFAVPALRQREDPFEVVRKIAEEIGPTSNVAG